MSLVWRKIQRSNKKAAKFGFCATFKELMIECTEKWQPTKVLVAWVHRRRRYTTRSYRWEPSLTDPLKGLIVWPENTENLDIVTTLYRDGRTESFEDKEWTFVVEEVTSKGKNRPLAAVSLNLRLFIHEMPGTQTEVKLKFRPLYEHVKSCLMQLVLTASVLKEGDALDDDMQSVASAMSVQNQVPRPIRLAPKAEMDIADLGDFDGEFSSAGSGFIGKNREAANKISEVVTDIEKWKEEHSPDDLFPSTSKHSPPIQKPVLSDTNSCPKLSSKTEEKKDLSDSVFQTSTGPCQPIFRQHLNEKPEVDICDGSFLTAASSAEKPVSNDSGLGPEPKLSNTTSNVSNNSHLSTSSLDPSQDLLSWCQEVTSDYRGVKITNFSSSWRNGLAFCALISHYRPDLINYNSLNPSDIRNNCHKAFEAAASIGVPRILDANEMLIMAIPDKIAVMTFVHSLRAKLTGRDSMIGDGSTNGDTTRHSILSLSELDANVMAEFEKLKREREHATAIDWSQEIINTSDVFVPDGISAMKSPFSAMTDSSDTRMPLDSPPVASTPKESLMTRNQLLNPFDSDSDNEQSQTSNEVPDEVEAANVTESPEDDSNEASPTKRKPSGELEFSALRRLSGGPRQEELRRRAKQLLEQYTKEENDEIETISDSARSSGEKNAINTDEEERQRKLRERARQMIAEAKQQTDGSAIKISETLSSPETIEIRTQPRPNTLPRGTHSAPNTRDATPELRRNLSINNCDVPKLKLRRSETLEGKVNFYQFRKRHSSGGGSTPSLNSPLSESRPLTRPSIPALGRSSERLNSPYIVAKPYPIQNQSPTTSETTLDRFRRFGSMRKQELTESINVLSTRIAHTVRSTSMPKELGVLNYSFKRPHVQQSMSVIASTDQVDSTPVKIESTWEKELASHHQIAFDLEEVNRKQQELDRRAVEVEKRLRQVSEQAQGSDEEKQLMNEYLTLLNERNLLVRREQYLNLLESIRDYEQRFNLVQQELGNLIQVEDADKTEAHKQKIDRLMEELITIVNKKDELVQQLMANEQETEEASEMSQNVLSQGGNLLQMQQDDKNCRIM